MNDVYLKMIIVLCVVQFEELCALGDWNTAEELICAIFALSTNEQRK